MASGYRCTVKILNSTPNTVITKTLVYFFYNGSSSYGSTDPATGVPGNVNTRPGEASYRFSRNDEDCVTRIEVIMVTDNSGVVDGAGDAPSGYCFSSPVVELVPNAAIRSGTTEKGPHLIVMGALDPSKPGIKTELMKAKTEPQVPGTTY